MRYQIERTTCATFGQTPAGAHTSASRRVLTGPNGQTSLPWLVRLVLVENPSANYTTVLHRVGQIEAVADDVRLDTAALVRAVESLEEHRGSVEVGFGSSQSLVIRRFDPNTPMESSDVSLDQENLAFQRGMLS